MWLVAWRILALKVHNLDRCMVDRDWFGRKWYDTADIFRQKTIYPPLLILLCLVVMLNRWLKNVLYSVCLILKLWKINWSNLQTFPETGNFKMITTRYLTFKALEWRGSKLSYWTTNNVKQSATTSDAWVTWISAWNYAARCTLYSPAGPEALSVVNWFH